MSYEHTWSEDGQLLALETERWLEICTEQPELVNDIECLRPAKPALRKRLGHFAFQLGIALGHCKWNMGYMVVDDRLPFSDTPPPDAEE